MTAIKSQKQLHKTRRVSNKKEDTGVVQSDSKASIAKRDKKILNQKLDLTPITKIAGIEKGWINKG